MRRDELLKSGAYTSIPDAVMTSTVLDPADKLVYAAILSHLRDNPTCNPGQAKLAIETGLSERGVCYCVANLIRHGFLSAEKHNGRPLIYTFLPLQTTAQVAVVTTEQSAVVEDVTPPHSVQTNHRTPCGTPPHSVPETTALCADETLTVLNTEDTEARKPSKPKPRGKKPPAQLPPVPITLNTPEFNAQWIRWQTHLAEKKRKLTPTSAAALLDELTTMGPARAAAAIKYSIPKGWLSINEKNAGARSTPSTNHDPEALRKQWEKENGLADDRNPTAAELANVFGMTETEVRRVYAEKGVTLP